MGWWGRLQCRFGRHDLWYQGPHVEQAALGRVWQCVRPECAHREWRFVQNLFGHDPDGPLKDLNVYTVTTFPRRREKD